VGTGLIGSPVGAAASAIASGIFNGAFIGIGHNFLHQRDNVRRHYQDIAGLSSAEFRMHHALSHHPYTNTVMDAELNSLLPEVSFFPVKKTTAEAIKARLALSISCAAAVPVWQLQRFARLVSGWDGGRYATSDKLAQLIPVAQLGILTALRGSPKGAVGLWMLSLMSTSNLFLWLNFLTGPHFNDECWHQGDMLDSRDWGLCQVQTSTERADMSHKDNLSANCINVAAFGLHHLHHLFPTIDASELSKLVPLFEEHCREWGVTFELMSREELRKGLWKCVDGYEPNDRPRNGIFRSKL